MQSPLPSDLRRLNITRVRIAVRCSVQTTQFPHSLQDDLNLGGHRLHSPLLLKLRGASQCVAPSSHLHMDTSANGYQADIDLKRHEPGDSLTCFDGNMRRHRLYIISFFCTNCEYHLPGHRVRARIALEASHARKKTAPLPIGFGSDICMLYAYRVQPLVPLRRH